MSTWPSRAQLNIDETRLAQLTDSEGARDVVDEATVETLRLEAVGLVESYCTDYVVPFVAPPANVVEWAIAIWRYKLYSHRPEMTCPETVRDDYDRAMKSLEKVADKKLPLNAPQLATGLPQSPTAGGLIDDIPRQFGRGRDGLG